MNNIITFKTYNWRKGETMDAKELVNYLTEKNKEGHKYTLEEIQNIAYEILSMYSPYSYQCATPIVKIAKIFNFKTYEESLQESGDININGDTFKKYGHDKVILVNENDELFHQRFVIAHELAHYLFDFLGNSKYEDPTILFKDTYQKDKHETYQEKRASTFAAEIMMPKKVFIQQYEIAKSVFDTRLYTLEYLSEYFETSVDSIARRITEVS
jgi:hypothetical protein